MFKFKKRAKEDRIKHMELKENRTEDVGLFSRFIRVVINIVKDASITLKSALGLKGRKTGNRDGSPEN
jgi:hypothetical protein